LIFFNAVIKNLLTVQGNLSHRESKISGVNDLVSLAKISFNTKPRFFLGSRECSLIFPNTLKKKSLVSFIASTFTFLLNSSQQYFYNDLTQQINKKIKVLNPILKFNPNYSMPYMWHSWLNFTSTLASLAKRGCFIFTITSQRLQSLAQAVSWHTFSGSHLH